MWTNTDESGHEVKDEQFSSIKGWWSWCHSYLHSSLQSVVDEPSLSSSTSQLVCQTIQGSCSNEDVVGELEGARASTWKCDRSWGPERCGPKSPPCVLWRHAVYQLHHYLCGSSKLEAKKLRLVFVKRRQLELQLWSKGIRFSYFHPHVLSDCYLNCKLALNQQTDSVFVSFPRDVPVYQTVTCLWSFWNQRCPRGDSQATVKLTMVASITPFLSLGYPLEAWLHGRAWKTSFQ